MIVKGWLGACRRNSLPIPLEESGIGNGGADASLGLALPS